MKEGQSTRARPRVSLMQPMQSTQQNVQQDTQSDTEKVDTDTESFVVVIAQHTKRVLVESKRLVDKVLSLTGPGEEEDISAPARDTALATFELLDYVTKHAHKRAKGIPLTCLVESTKDVRSAVLDLVQAARSVFSNPFDFLSKQTLDNCRNTVVSSIKAVIQAAESIESEVEEDNSASEDTTHTLPHDYDVVQDMRAANRALQSIFMCSRHPIAQDVFLQSAKGLLEAINQLMIISKTQGLGLEDRLKEDTTGVMNASKLLLRDFEDQSYHARFQEAMKQLQASLKAFLFACAKSKDGKVLEKVAISSVCYELNDCAFDLFMAGVAWSQ